MTAEVQLRADGAPRLRLFSPDAPDDDCTGSGGSDDSPSMTLSELFARDFIPLWIRGRNLDAKSETAYRESLSWWAKLTGDPPLCEISEFTTADFVARLCEQPGRASARLSLATVRRHCVNIQKLLQFAGPRGHKRHNRKNRGLLAEPPFVDGPEFEPPAPDGDFSLEQIHALYRAAPQMTQPSHIAGVQPGWWWRAVLVVGYYTGLRREQLLHMEYARLEVPWANGGRIEVSGEHGKRKRGYRRYLPAVALEHIDRIQTARDMIFAWGGCGRTLTRHFDKWLRLAGLPDRAGQGDKFHGFRKTHATQIAALDPQVMLRVAQASAGHSELATTTDHYIGGQVTELVQARAIDALPSPVPPDFVDCHERQRLLF